MQFALTLLSRVQETVGHIATACEVAEAAAIAANVATEPEGGSCLYPFVLVSRTLPVNDQSIEPLLHILKNSGYILVAP